MKRFLNKLFPILLLAILLVVMVLGFRMEISYWLMQARGQMKVLTQSIRIEKAKKSKHLSSKQKENLFLIPAIKKFAKDSLGLDIKNAYEKVFLQHGKPILWTLSACPEFELKPYQWNFAIVGEVGYKGFFNLDKANLELEDFKNKGYDASISEVSAWSTLGWFSDPILSNNLSLTNGEFVRLLFHEMTHATLYIESDDIFNENLATYIGNKGSLKFCQIHLNSSEEKRLEQRLMDIENYETLMLWGCQKLDSTYRSFNQMERAKKILVKKAVIASIIDSLSRIEFNIPEKFEGLVSNRESWNNTYFADFLMYHAQQDSIDELCKKMYGGRIKNMITAWK